MCRDAGWTWAPPHTCLDLYPLLGSFKARCIVLSLFLRTLVLFQARPPVVRPPVVRPHPLGGTQQPGRLGPRSAARPAPICVRPGKTRPSAPEIIARIPEQEPTAAIRLEESTRLGPPRPASARGGVWETVTPWSNIHPCEPVYPYHVRRAGPDGDHRVDVLASLLASLN